MKKVMKVMALLMVLMMAVSSLAGCGKTEEKSDSKATTELEKEDGDKKETDKEPILLKWWGGVPAESGPQEVADLFNKTYKDQGIQVEYTRYVNDDNGNLKLETNLLSGGEIDVFIAYNPERVQKKIDAKMALPLNELMEKEGYNLAEQIVPSFAELWEQEGKTYGIPTKIGNGGFLINKDMFDEAGIEIPTEWTIEEWQEVCAKLTSGEGVDKTYGAYMRTRSKPQNGVDIVKISLGGDAFYNDDGTASNLDHPYFETLLQTFYDMMHVDGSMPMHVDAITQKLTPEGMFLSGKAAMVNATYASRYVKDLENYPHDFVTAFAPYFTMAEDSEYFVDGGPGDTVMINSDSSNQEAAWEFVKWYVSTGFLEQVPFGRIPASLKADSEKTTELFLTGSEELFDAESTKTVYVEPGKQYTAVYEKDIALSQIVTIFKEECELAFLDETTVSEAIANMIKRADEAIAKELN